jgi:serine/threonine protein kinase
VARKFDATVLLEYIRRSGLVPEEQLRAAVAEWEAGLEGPLPEDPHAVADQLVTRGLLTRWQADNLLRGKFRGYFLGKFKLLGLLGSGGMSSVYLAEHVWLQRKQAIKVLPKKRVGDASYLERFRLEALATASLSHPHIVRLYDIDQEGDVHYLVMEYVRGETLQAIVARSGPIGYVEAALYVAQAARGLQYAHDAKMVHRDVKPANLLLDDTGTVKILDLGLALMQGDDAASLTLLHNENVLGTADYLAPEQALNSHDVDFRADIYGLGCTLYYLLTGHPPFPEGTLAQRISKHLTQSPPDVRSQRPDCPPDLAAVCVKMTQKDPSQRFPSMQAVAETLEAFVHNQPAQDPGPDPSGRPAGFTIELLPAADSDKARPDSSRKTDSSRKEVRRTASPDQAANPASPSGAGAGGEAVIPVERPVDPEPQILQGTLQPAGQPAREPTEVGDSGKLELGREVFTSAESSAELRHIREQRRQRQQQREKIMWRVGLAVLVLLLLAAVVFLVSQFFNSAPNRPRPKVAPPLTVKPKNRATSE